jgi:hypothetical protein
LQYYHLNPSRGEPEEPPETQTAPTGAANTCRSLSPHRRASSCVDLPKTLPELHRPAARAADVPDVAARELRRRRRQARARRARQRGRRFGTISYRRLASGRVPYLRLSGDWLRRAGFDQEQEFEITVGHGRLMIEAL